MSGKPVHGESYGPEYRAWQTARLRCTDPENAAWADYGGRGITMCDRWLNSVQAFVEDMGRKPSPRHEIDRIDNNGGYDPDNCRWATRKTNCRNRRSNHCVTLNDERLTLAEWSERTGLLPETIAERLDRGWTPERTLTTPARPKAAKGEGRYSRPSKFKPNLGLQIALAVDVPDLENC